MKALVKNNPDGSSRLIVYGREDVDFSIDSILRKKDHVVETRGFTLHLTEGERRQLIMKLGG